VPAFAYVTIVLPLSVTDTLTVYELGNWSRHWEKFDLDQEGGELSAPDTRLLVTRGGKAVFQYALKDLATTDPDSGDWWVNAVAMRAAHLCSDRLDVAYLVVQEGNSGGFYLALVRSGTSYKLVPVADAYQGRLVLFASDPRRIEVWTADGAGACGACSKPFVVEKLQFDGTKYRQISNHKARKEYAGFQNSPLVVNP